MSPPLTRQQLRVECGVHKPAVRDIGAPGVRDTKNFFEYAAFDYTSCAGVAQGLWRRLTTLRSLRQRRGTLEVEGACPDSSMAAAPFIPFGGCGRVPTRTKRLVRNL